MRSAVVEIPAKPRRPHFARQPRVDAVVSCEAREGPLGTTSRSARPRYSLHHEGAAPRASLPRALAGAARRAAMGPRLLKPLLRAARCGLALEPAEPAACRAANRVSAGQRAGIWWAMAPLSEDCLTPEPGDAAPGDPDAVVVAERLRAEMRSAVHSMREGLPRAFPRWERRRTEASKTATSERRQ
jgi:hypothetical protein